MPKNSAEQEAYAAPSKPNGGINTPPNMNK